MIGPRDDRDLFFTGNVTFDLIGAGPSGPPRVTPVLVGGGGFMIHFDEFRGERFTSGEGAFTAGGGARIRLGDRAYLAPEARLGWELHYRFGVTVGFNVR